jgi:hypothetical protein
VAFTDAVQQALERRGVVEISHAHGSGGQERGSVPVRVCDEGKDRPVRGQF